MKKVAEIAVLALLVFFLILWLRVTYLNFAPLWAALLLYALGGGVVGATHRIWSQALPWNL